MSSASSSSTSSGEDRKRKAAGADATDCDASCENIVDISAIPISNVPDCGPAIVRDVPADSMGNIEESGSIAEKNDVNRKKIDCNDDEVLAQNEGSEEEVESEGNTGATPKPAPTIIQIDFFEESSGTASLSVDFLSCRSTLYGAVEALFEYFLEDRLQEAIYSHIWIIKINKSKSFIGPFPESAFDDSQKPCIPMDPVPFDSLDLTAGQEIKFNYDLGCTTKILWRVISITPATEEDLANKKSFPRKTKKAALPPADPNASLVFLSDAELQESKTFRLKKEASVGTVWSSRQDKAVLAQSAAWSNQERKALCLLLYAEVPFAKAWSYYLEPTLLSRSKGATSVTWYATRNSIQECDSLHGEKHWLHDGGKLGSEREMPTKQMLLQRTEDILKAVRVTNLNWKPAESSKRRRMMEDDDDDDDDEELW